MAFKQIDRRLIMILVIVLVGMVGGSLIMPILPLYAQRHYHMTPAVITLLNAAFFAAQFIAGPYLGRLSDRHGRLPILIISQIGTALSLVMLAFAPNVAWLFAARILDGITGGNILLMPPLQALATSAVTDEGWGAWPLAIDDQFGDYSQHGYGGGLASPITPPYPSGSARCVPCS